MTKSSIATEYNEINENGRNGWMDKYQVNASISHRIRTKHFSKK